MLINIQSSAKPYLKDIFAALIDFEDDYLIFHQHPLSPEDYSGESLIFLRDEDDILQIFYDAAPATIEFDSFDDIDEQQLLALFSIEADRKLN